MTTAFAKRNVATKRRPAKRETAEKPWNLRRANGLQFLEAPALARLGWLVHGFSTRPGGASRLAPGTSGGVLNLGFTDWDTRAHVLENRKKFFHAIGADAMRVAALRQIHSDVAHRAVASEAEAPQGDALFTREPGVLLVVQTADCIPILLADTKRRAVAAIHSGWRGTLKRIAGKTLGRMQMEFGTRPEDVIAALGP